MISNTVSPDSMVTISNSSPLIILSKINQLDLLTKLYTEIIIPMGVYEEVITEGKGRPGIKIIQKLCDENKIKVREVKNRNLVTALTRGLDKGESEVIALAMEVDHDLILLDESDARKVASVYDLHFTGFIGVLIRAFQMGFIEDFKSELDQAIDSGFYIKDTLYNQLVNKFHL